RALPSCPTRRSSDLPIAEEVTGAWFACHVQVRAHAEPVPGRARVTTGDVDGTEAVVWQMELDQTIQGVAPGQTAVVYQGTRVLRSEEHTSELQSRFD